MKATLHKHCAALPLLAPPLAVPSCHSDAGPCKYFSPIPSRAKSVVEEGGVDRDLADERKSSPLPTAITCVYATL